MLIDHLRSLPAGELVEIERLRFDGSTQPAVHRLLTLVDESAREMIVTDGRATERVPFDEIRSVRAVSRPAAARAYHPGQRVRIGRYGSRYTATVQQPLRTRVRVAFQAGRGDRLRERVFDAAPHELTPNLDAPVTLL